MFVEVQWKVEEGQGMEGHVARVLVVCIKKFFLRFLSLESRFLPQ